MPHRRNRRRHPTPPPPPPPSPPTPPSPPIISHTTTAEILNHAASLFYSHLFIFLYVSHSLYRYRSEANGAVHNLSSRIDREPRLKSFTPLTDGEIFSGASVSDSDRLLSHIASRKPIVPNATLVPLSQFHPSHGIIAGFSFPEWELKTKITVAEEEESKFGENGLNDVETFLGWGFVIKRFEWRHRKDNSSLTLAGVVSITYAFHLLELILEYPWVHGVVFLKVVDNLVGNNNRRFYSTIWHGSGIGIWPSRFILMKWSVRAVLSHLIGVYFFWKVEDLCTFLKVLLSINFMPTFDLAPWVAGHEWESVGFAVIWFFIDFFACLISAIDPWILIVNERMRGGAREGLGECCHLLGALFYSAFVINVLEAVSCGSIGRLVLRMMFGEGFTMFLQAMMEIYFKIAWLLFYFAARQKVGAALGRSYGRREFEDLVNINNNNNA